MKGIHRWSRAQSDLSNSVHDQEDARHHAFQGSDSLGADNVSGMTRRLTEPIASTLKATLDLMAWGICLYTTAWIRIRFPFASGADSRILGLIGFTLVIQVAFGVAVGLYRFRWIYGSFDEVAALTLTALLTTATSTLANYFTSPRIAPRSVVLAGGMAALVGMAAIRYAVRLLGERLRRPNPDHPDAIRTLVYGAGSAGEQIVRAMLRDRQGRYVPVGILDDDQSKKRLTISGVRVLGKITDLANVAVTTNARAVLIATPEANAIVVATVTALAEDGKIPLIVKVLPGLGELIDQNIDVGDIRDVNEVDVLGRHQIETDVAAIAGYIRGKKILVTGAGGSIGSELCRQLHQFSPAELLMLDRDESALHSVQLSIEGRALLDTPSLILADIRDADALTKLFAERRPEVVFHAAALKHLPLLEMYPPEAIKTNVYGTLNVLDAAVRSGVERFVNISTDKAADPVSVLGYSKRAAEILTSSVASKSSGKYMSVRFGNVLGSRGSFIHAFRSQIENGGPVTVTDRDVTRYFMTIPEAVQLVIQAGSIGTNGDVLILDMGQPVKIADVARQMIRRSGRDIKILYSGLRPGEKLHEQLIGHDENAFPTSHELITRTPVPNEGIPLPVPISIPDDHDKQLDLLAGWCASERPSQLHSDDSKPSNTG